MIKVGDKKWNQLEDRAKIAHCKDSLVNFAKKERRVHDYKWYIGQEFLDGNHYIYWNSVTNAIETPPRRRGEVRLVINRTKEAYRSVQNYATRREPRFECVPSDLDEETIKNAHRSTKFLDYVFRKLHLKTKVRQLVGKGLLTSVGVWEIGWDEEAEDGKGEIFVTNQDPFDIYVPSTAILDGPIIHSPFVGKVVTRHVDEVRSDERYNEKTRKKVDPDNELSLSTMKSRSLRRRGQKKSRSEGQETVLVYEVMLYDHAGNDNGGNIQLVTFAGDQLLRDEATELTDYPYRFYKPDGENIPYSYAWINDLIPINKALNRLQSLQLRYNNEVSQLRVLSEHGANVNWSATGRSGMDVEVIEHAAGRNVEQWKMSPLPSTIHRQNADLDRYIEDVSGAHQASLGSIPQGARSGKTLEALQAGDANNLSGITGALEDFLAVVGQDILELASEKYQTSRVIKITDPESEPYAKVIGANASQRPEGAGIITDDNEVIVKIGSYLGHTLEAQRETLMELSDRNVIPREMVLNYYGFPNIEELSHKARMEKLEEHEMQAEIAGRRGEGGEGAPQGPGGEDMLALADQENMQMMNGAVLEPTPGATPEHTQGHVDFVKSQAQQGGEGVDIIVQHARGEAERGGY